MKKSFAMVALAVVAAASFIGGCRIVVRQQPTDGKLLVFHMDFNIIQMNRATVSDLLRKAADNGYNAILWEIENKVQLDTIPPAIHPEAFTKDEFRAILAEADALGLEAIPLLQTFGHGEYVLNCKEYKHLREQHDKPDCYCVSKPEVRELHLRLVNEYLQLFGDRVKRFHLASDEAYSYGSCPICKKRNRIELYVEHLEALAKPIRERGIRPGVWHDMILDPQHAADRAKMPADYTIWYGDYGYGVNKASTTAGDKKIESLRKEGREVILCGASQSAGEDPFFPRAKFHRDNLTALAEKARKTCAGFCVTSWSIRQSLKRFQYPLIDYAAQRYLAPSADAAEDWKAAVTRAFGAEVTPEMVDGLFSCDYYLNGVDGRQWTFFKEGIPPPPLYYRQWMKDYPTYVDNFADRAAKEKARVIQELAKWKAIKSGNELVALAVRAGEMKLVLCETIRAALKGEKYSPCPLDEVAALYSVDQSKISAANSARLVFGFYAD